MQISMDRDQPSVVSVPPLYLTPHERAREETSKNAAFTALLMLTAHSRRMGVFPSFLPSSQQWSQSKMIRGKNDPVTEWLYSRPVSLLKDVFCAPRVQGLRD